MIAGLAAGDDRRRAAGRHRHRAVLARPRWPACRGWSSGERRAPPTLALFGAIDDVGLTVGPALGGVLPRRDRADDADRHQRRHLRDLGADHRRAAVDACAARRAADRRRDPRSLFADARAGVREVAAPPRDPRPARVLDRRRAVHRHHQRRRGRPRPRGPATSAAPAWPLMVAAGGLGTDPRLPQRPLHHRRRLGAGAGLPRSASVAMAAELIACARPALLPRSSCSPWRSAASATALALVHDRLLLASSAPESLHGRLFALQKTCVSVAFALSFLGAGALIAAAGVQLRLPRLRASASASSRLAAVPRLRKAWPTPGHRTARRRASLGAHGEIAQLVEHTTENRGVPGSSPGLAIRSPPSIRASRTIRLRGADVPKASR